MRMDDVAFSTNGKRLAAWSSSKGLFFDVWIATASEDKRARI